MASSPQPVVPVNDGWVAAILDLPGTATTVGFGPEAPCDVEVGTTAGGRWHIRCAAHDCEAQTSPHADTEQEAREAFVCDLGLQLAFIVHRLEDNPFPALVDLTGLKEAVEQYIQQQESGELCSLGVVRYLTHDAGICRHVELEYHPIRADGSPVDQFGDESGSATRFRARLFDADVLGIVYLDTVVTVA